MASDGPITKTVCSDCGHCPDEESPYCPECGADATWVETPEYEFDEDDLPVYFSYRIYDDNYELWDYFCESYFGVRGLKGSDTVGIPDDFPELAFIEEEIFFAVTEELELEGPFLSEWAAKQAIEGE